MARSGVRRSRSTGSGSCGEDGYRLRCCSAAVLLLPATRWCQGVEAPTRSASKRLAAVVQQQAAQQPAATLWPHSHPDRKEDVELTLVLRRQPTQRQFRLVERAWHHAHFTRDLDHAGAAAEAGADVRS